MAKTLKDFLEGYLKVKSADEQKFIDKHVTAKNPDRNGNGDDVFKGNTKPIDRRKERKGYNPGEDEKVYEELKGNQHKIDANKNGKVDAHDFHLLRKKKKVNEASYKEGETRMGSVGPITTDAERAERAKKYREKMMKKESADYLETDLKKRKKNNDKAIEDMKKMGSPMKNPHFGEEVEQIDELSTPTLQSYRKKARAQGNAIVDKMKMGGGDWSKDQKDTKTLRKRAAGAQASGKQLVKRGESLKTEEVEQIDELDRQLGGTLSRYINKTKDNPKREKGRELALSKRWGDTKYGTPEPKVKAVDRFKEEVEPIEELSKATLRSYAQNAKDQMSRSDTLAGREMGARTAGAKPSAKERMHNRRADKRHAGLGLAIDKLAREEVEHIEEAGYSAKAARAGKDIGKPGKQFAKIASAAAKKYGSAERGQKVAGAVLAKLRKEEKLADLISDLSESHQRTMMNVFEKLNEDNKSKFLEACDTPDGVEQMLDFAINHRGE